MAKTMKRIEHFVRGKGVLESKFAFRESKINRTLEQLIESAEESAQDAEAQADAALEKLVHVADSSEAIARVLNEFVEQKTIANDYRDSKKILEDLKTALQEEVVVEPDAIAVEVVTE